MAHEYEGNDVHWFCNYSGNCKWCNKSFSPPIRILARRLQWAYVPYCSNKCLNEDTSNPIRYYESTIEQFINSGKKKSDDEYFERKRIEAAKNWEIKSKKQEDEKKQREEEAEKLLKARKEAELQKIEEEIQIREKKMAVGKIGWWIIFILYILWALKKMM